jgi:hypothetical protein
MSCHPRVTEGTSTIQGHLPHLTRPQATVLALWSLGMVLARSCALTAVSAFLAPWLGRQENTVRQQLREFCDEAAAKRGTARGDLRVELCFVPLLAWVVSLWQGTQLALALEATPVGTRFTVLVVSVVYRGCAIPVAGVVLSATATHAWRREWLRLLRPVHRAVPRSWTVLVLAERGLYARWLFRRITRLGWHPVLRINTGGTFRPAGRVHGVPLKTLVPQPGTSWQGTGIAFKGRHRQLHGTLLARWEAGYKDPWLILTDRPPEASTACWYGLRAWIEHGLKSTTRAGWPPVAGRRRGHLVAAERRGRGGRDHPGEHGPRRHGPHPSATADAACHTPAAGECLSPRLEPDPGGVARPGTVAPGPLCPRTLACYPGTRGGDTRPAGAGAAPGRVRPQAARATGTGMRGTIWAS